MTKKTIILAVLYAFVTLPACAQYMGPHFLLETTKENTLLQAKVQRAVTKHLFEPVCQWLEDIHDDWFGATCNAGVYQFKQYDWQALVRGEEIVVNRNGPLGSSFYAVTTPSFKQKPVAPQDKESYQQRFTRLQRAISANSTLKKYKLAVPNPTDLVTLGQGNPHWKLADLTSWLTDPDYSKMMECSRPVPGVVAISFTDYRTIQNPDINVARIVEFNLWIDTRTKTVYLLNDGKYYGETD